MGPFRFDADGVATCGAAINGSAFLRLRSLTGPRMPTAPPAAPFVHLRLRRIVVRSCRSPSRITAAQQPPPHIPHTWCTKVTKGLQIVGDELKWTRWKQRNVSASRRRGRRHARAVGAPGSTTSNPSAGAGACGARTRADVPPMPNAPPPPVPVRPCALLKYPGVVPRCSGPSSCPVTSIPRKPSNSSSPTHRPSCCCCPVLSAGSTTDTWTPRSGTDCAC